MSLFAHPIPAPNDSVVGSDLNGMTDPASIALGRVLSKSQDAFVLTDIEARLTQEVRGLIAALTQFSRRAELIREEIPDGAEFTKLVTGSLVLISLQFAHALGKGLDKPIFFDDGAQYLRELNLCLSDFVREVDLDGRRFLAIALVDQKLGQLSSTSDGGNK